MEILAKLAAAIYTMAAAWLPQAADKVDITKMVGQQAPAFSMSVASGAPTNTTTVTKDTLKGKVVLIDFWATWCGPCKAASPTMQKLHTTYANRGLVVIGANGLEQQRGPSAARQYAQQNGFTYMMTYDNDDLMTRWSIEGIPTFILIDKTGTVSWVGSGWGASSAEQLEERIKRLL